MKKHYLLTPLIVLASLPLSACGSDTKIELFREDGLTTFITIDAASYRDKIANEDSFLLLVYSSTCLSCREFEKVLNSYISTTSAMIYAISTTDASTANLTIKTTPTLIVYKEGNEKARVSETDPAVQTAAGFQSFIDKHFFLSSRISIDEEKFRELKEAEDEFIILFSWSKCGDCQFLNESFFNKFRAKHPDWTFYELDLHEYYDLRENSDDPIWTNMTKEFGLSKESTEGFGYRNGVVPTFQLRKNKTISKAAVVFNDEYAVETKDGQTTSLTVEGSYYADAPFIGQTFKATKDKSVYTVYKEKTSSFYEKKVIELFDQMY